MDPTFKSYIDRDGELLEPSLLPGDVIIGRAHKVMQLYPLLKGSPRGQDISDISGSLYCTLFKASFIEEQSHETQNGFQEKPKANSLILGDNEFPLAGISGVYQVSKGKRKKMVPGVVLTDKIKKIEIVCKDFRKFSFQFKSTAKDEARNVLHAILHHAFPSRPDHFFAFSYKPPGPPQVERPSYQVTKDFEMEVLRQRARCWRADRLNYQCQLSQNMPEAFVLPRSLINAEVKRRSGHFVEQRVPMWSFTYSKGSSLVRMAYVRPDSPEQDVAKDLISAVNRTAPHKDGPFLEDLGKSFPTPKELKRSYDKLREMCAPVTVKEYWTTDRQWGSLLEDSRWLQYVAHSLEVAARCVHKICDKARTVIISEYNSRDYCCVVSSLTQVLIDPYFRTIEGFENLVQREWVAAGHKFASRLGLINTPEKDSEESPVFLLFLDCMWQLLQQFPLLFEFSETYLTILWDSANSGLFHTFLFDNSWTYIQQKDFEKMQKTDKKLPQVWDWGVQLSVDNQALLRNPLFIARTDKDLLEDLKSAMKPTRHSIKNQKNYAKKLNGIYAYEGKSFKTGVIKPQVESALMQFWSQLYLRWLEPAKIQQGGSPAEYFMQCLLVEELLCMKRKIECMSSNTPYKNPDKHKNLFFSGSSLDNGDLSLSLVKTQAELISSSYPFMAQMPAISKHLLGTSPITHFLDNSEFNDEEGFKRLNEDLGTLATRSSFLED
ncbi:myotubularin-related protein 10-B-like [Tubulanus polymorphus]|uniref:myotubularin-related protein 10-B-like n=1 Tax=Tubulanus polymorphus TaxID=672921 RepID=UPI003DA6BC80